MLQHLHNQSQSDASIFCQSQSFVLTSTLFLTSFYCGDLVRNQPTTNTNDYGYTSVKSSCINRRTIFQFIFTNFRSSAFPAKSFFLTTRARTLSKFLKSFFDFTLFFSAQIKRPFKLLFSIRLQSYIFLLTQPNKTLTNFQL